MQANAHVHGFHSYPARLHPHTAARLVEGLSAAGATVLDPFCGSGTTVVESALQGRHPIGSDLNPLALELCWLKTKPWTTPGLAQLQDGATRAADFAEERRLARRGPLTRYADAARRAFPVHVLLELDGLSHGIRALSHATTRRALVLVLSSLLTKVSNRRSDSSNREVTRRLKSGFTIELFVDKTKELAKRLARYTELLPAPPPPVRLHNCDARRLTKVPPGSVDLVVTSPPYPGVFDYLEHHRARLAFLELPSGPFEAGEIGARRNFKKLGFERAVERWRTELSPCLGEIARVLRPGGHAALVVADTAVAGGALEADTQNRQVGRPCGPRTRAHRLASSPELPPRQRRRLSTKATPRAPAFVPRLLTAASPTRQRVPTTLRSGSLGSCPAAVEARAAGRVRYARLRATRELDVVDPDVEVSPLVVDLELNAVQSGRLDTGHFGGAPTTLLLEVVPRQHPCLPFVGEHQVVPEAVVALAADAPCRIGLAIG